MIFKNILEACMVFHKQTCMQLYPELTKGHLSLAVFHYVQGKAQ